MRYLTRFFFFIFYYNSMCKLCPRCLNVSKGQFFIFPGSLLLGGFFIGIGIMNINGDLFGSRVLSLLLSILLIPSGFLYLLSYFFGGKTCPNCGHREMLPLSSREAKEVKNAGKFEHGYMLCHSCFNISEFVDTRTPNKYGSLALALFGMLNIIYLLINGENTSTQYFEWLGSLIFLCVGIYGFGSYLMANHHCPQCGNKNTMIPLDTPKAQMLIKEHNLTIPEQTIKEPAPKTTTQSN